MATTVAEVMAHEPVTVNADTPISEAAREMRTSNTGDVLVMDSGRLVGIVTDRDIAIRIVAENKDPNTPAREAVSAGDLPRSPPTPRWNRPPRSCVAERSAGFPSWRVTDPSASSASATSPSNATKLQRWPTSALPNPTSSPDCQSSRALVGRSCPTLSRLRSPHGRGTIRRQAVPRNPSRRAPRTGALLPGRPRSCSLQPAADWPAG